MSKTLVDQTPNKIWTMRDFNINYYDSEWDTIQGCGSKLHARDKYRLTFGILMDMIGKL